MQAMNEPRFLHFWIYTIDLHNHHSVGDLRYHKYLTITIGVHIMDTFIGMPSIRPVPSEWSLSWPQLWKSQPWRQIARMLTWQTSWWACSLWTLTVMWCANVHGNAAQNYAHVFHPILRVMQSVTQETISVPTWLIEINVFILNCSSVFVNHLARVTKYNYFQSPMKESMDLGIKKMKTILIAAILYDVLLLSPVLICNDMKPVHI